MTAIFRVFSAIISYSEKVETHFRVTPLFLELMHMSGEIRPCNIVKTYVREKLGQNIYSRDASRDSRSASRVRSIAMYTRNNNGFHTINDSPRWKRTDVVSVT